MLPLSANVDVSSGVRGLIFGLSKIFVCEQRRPSICADWPASPLLNTAKVPKLHMLAHAMTKMPNVLTFTFYVLRQCKIYIF